MSSPRRSIPAPLVRADFASLEQRLVGIFSRHGRLWRKYRVEFHDGTTAIIAAPTTRMPRPPKRSWRANGRRSLALWVPS